VDQATGGSRSRAADVEALLLASPAPVPLEALGRHLPGGRPEAEAIVDGLKEFWSGRGMAVQVKDGAAALVPDQACLRVLAEVQGKKARRLSQAAVETLSYIALNQPVTLADIERGRGLKLHKGVIDSLLDAGMVRVSARRTDSGRALTYVTTEAFLEHFGLSALSDLPTPEELPDLVDAPADPEGVE